MVEQLVTPMAYKLTPVTLSLLERSDKIGVLTDDFGTLSVIFGLLSVRLIWALCGTVGYVMGT